jgi:hypothetical protein
MTRARASSLTYGSGCLSDQFFQVGAVAGFAEALDLFVELGAVDPVLAEGDFFEAGDFQALAVFDDLDELTGGEQRVVRAGVEPGGAAAEEISSSPRLEGLRALARRTTSWS